VDALLQLSTHSEGSVGRFYAQDAHNNAEMVALESADTKAAGHRTLREH